MLFNKNTKNKLHVWSMGVKIKEKKNTHQLWKMIFRKLLVISIILFQVMEVIGNKKANEKFEMYVPPFYRRPKKNDVE